MNKHGWGLRVELAFLLLFLVCIIISTIGLHKLGLLATSDGGDMNLKEYTQDSGAFDYDSLEAKVSSAARNYYNNNYPDGSLDTVIVSVSTLKRNGYLTPIYDSRNKECSGYAKILNTGTCVSYIKCSLYKTVGYNEDYE